MSLFKAYEEITRLWWAAQYAELLKRHDEKLKAAQKQEAKP
jgi:hypothetical protein